MAVRFVPACDQPASVVSMRLSVSNPSAWVRMEALSPHTGELLARTSGRGVATFIALPPPPPAPEDAEGAPAPPGKGGKDAGKGAKGAKGGKGGAPSPEEALAQFVESKASIASAIKGDSDVVMQVRTAVPWRRMSPHPGVVFARAFEVALVSLLPGIPSVFRLTVSAMSAHYVLVAASRVCCWSHVPVSGFN